MNIVKNIIDSDYIIYKFAFACADEPLWKACDAVDEYIWEALQYVPPGELVVILTGSKCFRRDKYPDYKGNRKTDKPEHYEGLREHLVQEWEAVVTDDGYEADDWCGDIQRSGLSGRSKDL